VELILILIWFGLMSDDLVFAWGMDWDKEFRKRCMHTTAFGQLVSQGIKVWSNAY